MTIYPSDAPEIKKKYMTRYRNKIKKERPWMMHWIAVRSRCQSPSNRYFKKGIKNELTKEDVRSLWERDNAKSMAKPSIDRINTSLGYFPNNCRFIEWKENKERTTSRPDGMFVQQFSVDDKPMKIFLNAKEAERYTGIHRTGIGFCIKGKYSHAGGYRWRLIRPTNAIRKSLEAS